jgi:hypothetical protein
MNPPLKAGDGLQVKKKDQLLQEDRLLLERLRVSRADSIWVTAADANGISIFVARLHPLPAIEGFIPKTGVGLRNWSSYFEPTGRTASAYASQKNKHAAKVFPRDF